MKTGVYKTIFADVWEQDWFLDLTVEEKIVFLNILTSRYNRQIGVYLPVIRFQAMQCGISKEQFIAIIDDFVERGILLRSTVTGEIAIPSYLIEHFGKGGEPAMTLLKNEAGSVKDQIFLQTILYENLSEVNSRKDLSINKTLLDFLGGYQKAPTDSLIPVNQTVVTKVDDRSGPMTAFADEERCGALKSAPAPQHASEMYPLKAKPYSDHQVDSDRNAATIYSVFQSGKYADEGKSYLDIAREDPGYARWWAEKKDVHNPQIQNLFKRALLVAEEEQSTEENQIEKFKKEYPQSYQNEAALRHLSHMPSDEVSDMLDFLWICNDMNWSFTENIPEADYYVLHWNEMREEGLRNGYPFDIYHLPF